MELTQVNKNNSFLDVNHKLSKSERFELLKNTLIETPMDLLAFIVVPIALLQCKKEDQYLPKWARWFDEDTYGINAEIVNPDGTITHSDEAHCGANGRFPRPKNRTWYARLRWLLRNRIGVFTTEVMGIKFSDIDPLTIKIYGDMDTPSYSGRKGNAWGKIEAKTFDGKPVWGYFSNTVWGKIFYVRKFLGYKIFDISHIAKEPNDQARIEAMKKFLSNPTSKIYAKSVCAINYFRLIKKTK